MNISCIIFLLLLYSVRANEDPVTRIRSVCLSGLPTHPFNGTGCGTPLTVVLESFGDNARSSGLLRAVQRDNKVCITISLKDLPRPDLVLTTWILWAIPGMATDPIFKIGSIDSPLAPTTAAYTSGLGREPNQFKYTSRDTAKLHVKLDFNPTFPGEGPLRGIRACVQKDIPGIEDTEFQQPPVPEGVFTPVGGFFLRKYDSSGFEVFDEQGRPELVRSPVAAIAIIVAAHIDMTTHGISPGNFPSDNYELLSFAIRQPFGEPIFTA